MNGIAMTVEGIGFWAQGVPGIEAARVLIGGGLPVDGAPPKPSPQLLAPNERRRAPDTVAVALEVAQAACAAASRDPATLASVFASTHGELAITDYMCETLADAPLSISPTRFHNSVHNAAAGYWAIGAGCHAPTTAMSAHSASFAQALVDAAATLHCERAPVLLVAYDASAPGPLATISPSQGLLGAALVLGPEPREGCARIRIELESGDAPPPTGVLAEYLGANAMAPLLPLVELLIGGGSGTLLIAAGSGSRLRVEVQA